MWEFFFLQILSMWVDQSLFNMFLTMDKERPKTTISHIFTVAKIIFWGFTYSVKTELAKD